MRQSRQLIVWSVEVGSGRDMNVVAPPIHQIEEMPTGSWPPWGPGAKMDPMSEPTHPQFKEGFSVGMFFGVALVAVVFLLLS